MRSVKIFGFGLLALAVVGAIAEQRHFDALAQTAMGVTDPSKVLMRPAPITPDWVIEGDPTTLAAEIAHTDDGSTKTYVWSTTKSRFHWFYESDEIVTVLDGEVFVDDGINGERRLGPGDVAFFPTGAKTTWRVPDHLRKVATLKRPLPSPFASVLRWLKEVKQMIKPSSSAFAS